MKKVLIIILSTCITSVSWGQRDIQSANNYLGDKDYDHALEYIEKAVKDPSTYNNPKTWMVRGNIYLAMYQDTAKFKKNTYYRESATSFMKAGELKPDYEKTAVSGNLLSFAYKYYNDGVKAFNERTPEKYAEAADLMQKVVELHDFEVKQKYSFPAGFDTVSMLAKNVIANSYYYENKNEDALAMYNIVKNSHMVTGADIYVHIADIYEKQNKQEDKLAIIKEGREAFPKDESLKAMEINYYIKTGKQDQLVGKLEESVKEHPDNPELWYNLGTIYMNAANPKGGTPPANASELSAKAEQAYVTAIKLDSNNVDYNYNIGAMYFNQAVDVNEKMNGISGTSAAENKRYDALKTVRDSYFAKAEPYLEKSYSILDAKGANMRKEDRATYMATLSSLQSIYSKQNKTDKATEMTKKLQGKK